jgi:HPt (histidine-containing phosphotransfer) domain-containing protein
MSSSTSDGNPIDSRHLEQMTLGDGRLESEILTLFSAQAADLIDALAKLPPDAAGVAHKLKGSARAVGAFGVAAAVENLEHVMRNSGETSDALNALQKAVAQARAAIDAKLRRS